MAKKTTKPASDEASTIAEKPAASPQVATWLVECAPLSASLEVEASTADEACSKFREACSGLDEKAPLTASRKAAD